jgi:hypothetical protein
VNAPEQEALSGKVLVIADPAPQPGHTVVMPAMTSADTTLQWP